MSIALDRRIAVFAVLAVLLAAASGWAMTLGSTDLSFAGALRAAAVSDGSREHLVVATVRLPRILVAILAGSSLAVAGAIMQAMTGNPLASPSLLGINAGAAFAVVLAIVLFDLRSSEFYVWSAFAGAAAAAFAVYGAGSMGRSGATPLKLALAGAILSTFLASLTTSVLIFDRSTLDDVRMWTIGSLSGRSLQQVAGVLPHVLLGLAGAMLFRRQITTMSLGNEVARSVGQNLVLWRLVAGAIVVLLAGSAVAIAGPVGFVGLVVPHVARLIVGRDYRWIIPFSAIGGALLVVVADALLRDVLPGRDIPVGITMALIGAPFFVYLARYRVAGIA